MPTIFFPFSFAFEPDQKVGKKPDTYNCKNTIKFKRQQKRNYDSHFFHPESPKRLIWMTNSVFTQRLASRNAQQRAEECARTCEYVCVGRCMGPQVSWTVCEGFQCDSECDNMHRNNVRRGGGEWNKCHSPLKYTLNNFVKLIAKGKVTETQILIMFQCFSV